jgi:hypothetical protein
MAVYTAIDDAGSFYSTKLYTGTGSSLAVTGVGFQPDFTWIKNRDATDSHIWTDAVIGATIYRESNTTAADVTDTESLKTFDSDGFTVGTMAAVNTNTENYVSWNWKAGTTTGITTDGNTTITPSAYSFNQTSGISVIEYTGNETAGAKVAHGLGAVPVCMIFKRTDGVTDWQVYHQAIGNTKFMILNTTSAEGVATTRWNDTTPDSVNLTLGTTTYVNKSGSPHVGYIFADVQGYSKFGSYIGNGNADGPFVYTGFRPAYVLLKRTAGADAWQIVDNKRLGYNAKNSSLMACRTTAEDTSVSYIDILSNGFKLRTTGGHVNTNAELNIYMAFAESPFVNSSSIPGTAR